jgi:hypothetical protein
MAMPETFAAEIEAFAFGRSRQCRISPLDMDTKS